MTDTEHTTSGSNEEDNNHITYLNCALGVVEGRLEKIVAVSLRTFSPT